MQVVGTTDAWGAGDGTAVPDLTSETGAECAPNAQHAVRQSKVLADNIIARTARVSAATSTSTSTSAPWPGWASSRASRTSTASSCKGPIAWFMHRTYHVSRVPTFNRKVRVIADWTLALFFKREIVSLWSMHEPFTRVQGSRRRRTSRPAQRRRHLPRPDADVRSAGTWPYAGGALPGWRNWQPLAT